MNNSEKNNAVVNDLLLTQAERVAIYEKLLKYVQSEETPVRRLFEKIIFQSRQCIAELRPYIDSAYREPADRVEIKKEIHSCWPDIQYSFPGSPLEQTILCAECVENATLHTYEKTLDGSDTCPGEELRQVLFSHMLMIRESSKSVYELKIKPTAPEVTTSIIFSRENIFA